MDFGNAGRAVFLSLAFLGWLLVPVSAEAHGTGWRQELNLEVVALAFFYSDQSPMAYSRIKVFSPADAKIEYQNARTDKHGGFAFRPDQPGLWKFEVADGQGHLAAGEITVAAPGSGPAAEPPAAGGAPAPGLLAIVLGLSLILNFSLLAAALTKGKKP